MNGNRRADPAPPERRYTWLHPALLISLGTILLFSIFIWQFERYQHRQMEENLHQYANLLKTYVWNMDYENSREYLEFITQSTSWFSIRLVERDGDLFAESERDPQLSSLGQLLQSISLIGETSLSHPVNYRDRHLATLEGRWINRGIYVHVTVGFILFLTGIALFSGIRNVQRNRELDALKLEKEIRERERAEKRVERMAYYDTLTGLPNRNLFKERLESFISSADIHNSRIAIVFLDLDQFKEINDAFGHPLGDKLLKKVADELKNATIDGEFLISRWGGDEFILLFPNAGENEQIEQKIDSLLDVFTSGFEVNERLLHLQASAGVALYPDHGKTVDTLISNADIAMFQAKRGPNLESYSFYEEGSKETTRRNVKLVNQLREGIKQDQLKVYFQPQLDYKQKQISRVEALVRWQHPNEGLLEPFDFLPLVENSDLIHPLGEWMLENACLQAKRIQQEIGNPIPVAVNISVHQLRKPGFSELVAGILESADYPPERLELEITENTLIVEFEKISNVLSELREMGIRLAMDDFGTGFSSLRYLARLPIQTVKIDRVFVKDILENEYHADLVGLLQVISQRLNLNLVAEGVETIGQLDSLLDRQISVIQGFLFSKPVALEALLKKIQPEALEEHLEILQDQRGEKVSNQSGSSHGN